MQEIEIKAWLDDKEKTENRVKENCLFVKSFVKNDFYFEKADCPNIRLREINSRIIITSKKKTSFNGIEVNKESEFSLDTSNTAVLDSKNGFLSLLDEIGYIQFFSKSKTGSLYQKKIEEIEFNIEVMNINGLGDFIEIETVYEDDKDLNILKLESLLKKLLATFSVPPEKIESKPYISLFKAL